MQLNDSAKMMNENDTFWPQLLQNSPRELDRKIWKNALEINKTRHVLFDRNDDGVLHVKNSNGSFAFIVDSPILEAAVASFCELAQVGDIVNRKFWAIPLRKGKVFSIASFKSVQLKPCK